MASVGLGLKDGSLFVIERTWPWPRVGNLSSADPPRVGGYQKLVGGFEVESRDIRGSNASFLPFPPPTPPIPRDVGQVSRPLSQVNAIRGAWLSSKAKDTRRKLVQKSSNLSHALDKLIRVQGLGRPSFEGLGIARTH
jgi:hypothetical protein